MARDDSETFTSEPGAPKFRKEKPRKGGKQRRGSGRDKRESSGRSREGSRSERPRRDSFRGSDRSRGKTNSAMHRVKCDKCQKMCDVPFLPTENKPVYCSNCFRKDGGSSKGNNDSLLKEINKKLDIIIKGLDL